MPDALRASDSLWLASPGGLRRSATQRRTAPAVPPGSVVFDDFAAQGLLPQDGAHAPAPRRGFEPIGSVLAPLCADALSACSVIGYKTRGCSVGFPDGFICPVPLTRKCHGAIAPSSAKHKGLVRMCGDAFASRIRYGKGPYLIQPLRGKRASRLGR